MLLQGQTLSIRSALGLEELRKAGSRCSHFYPEKIMNSTGRNEGEYQVYQKDTIGFRKNSFFKVDMAKFTFIETLLG